MEPKTPPTPAEDPLPVLAVDLDGTLIASDLLLECLWDALSRDLPAALGPLSDLCRGHRARAKARLAALASIDLAGLSWNQAALARVRAHRAAGGRTALVTAADRHLAEAVAQHLGLFDAVHASDGVTNLKGAAKAAHLTAAYPGPAGFAYMGDAGADLPVWRASRRAITVGVAPPLRRQVDALGLEVEHLVAG
ncbi:MAG: haloacid dehalogenase-like hydrolase, partial [Pseudomonadota bacterium]